MQFTIFFPEKNCAFCTGREITVTEKKRKAELKEQAKEEQMKTDAAYDFDLVQLFKDCFSVSIPSEIFKWLDKEHEYSCVNI